MIDQLIPQIMLAIGLGAVLGFERQFSKKEKIAGLRTFSLISLLGMVSISLSRSTGNYLFAVIGLIFISFYSIYLFFKTKNSRIGFTTNISLVLTFAIGMMVGLDLFWESVFLTIATTVILFSKETLHTFIENLTQKEVTDFLQFLILLGIVYPLIPSEFAIKNITIPLLSIWQLIVFVSIINFIVFLASRHLKTRYNTELISLLSGFVASTALVVTLTNIFKKKRYLKNIILGFNSSMISMVLRNMGLAVIMFPALFEQVWIPFLILISALIVPVFLKYRDLTTSSRLKAKIKSPFNVPEAVRMGLAILVFIVIIDLFKSLNPQFFYLASFLGGMASSLSFTISLVSLLLSNQIALENAGTSLIFACLGSFTSTLFVLALRKRKDFFVENAATIFLFYVLPLMYLFFI